MFQCVEGAEEAALDGRHDRHVDIGAFMHVEVTEGKRERLWTIIESKARGTIQILICERKKQLFLSHDIMGT